MPLIDWLKSYFMVFFPTCPALALVHFLKGRDFEYCLRFGLIWGSLTGVTFLLVKGYKLKNAGISLLVRDHAK